MKIILKKIVFVRVLENEKNYEKLHKMLEEEKEILIKGDGFFFFLRFDFYMIYSHFKKEIHTDIYSSFNEFEDYTTKEKSLFVTSPHVAKYQYLDKKNISIKCFNVKLKKISEKRIDKILILEKEIKIKKIDLLNSFYNFMNEVYNYLFKKQKIAIMHKDYVKFYDRLILNLKKRIENEK